LFIIWRRFLAITQATETIALGCLHPGVTIFNLARLNAQAAPSAVMQLQGHLSPVVALSWSHNHRVLAAGDVDGSLILWRNGR
jgi:WD40 repeat protein